MPTVGDYMERAKVLRSQLDSCIEELFQITQAVVEALDEVEDGSGLIVCDYMVIVAYQGADEFGNRHGDVSLILKDKSMPKYIARGIVDSAREKIEQNGRQCTCREEDDDD